MELFHQEHEFGHPPRVCFVHKHSNRFRHRLDAGQGRFGSGSDAEGIVVGDVKTIGDGTVS
jgi:hypothetical protein